MRLKHKLKQFTAIALSCLSVISTPLTAYAVGGNTGSGDNEGIVVSAEEMDALEESIR